ncbi:MAG: ATP-dependent helicase [Desulfovibrio sp.]|jgi:DNA helicase-2/ATP-dependent DNA helicase PcrA|nr:ATP-dependent helicase [Desulfovibrio sp.]
MIDYAKTLNEAQYAAVSSGDGPVLVVAGAGSGKTRAIVYRLAWLAEHGVPQGSILLLTFTRKAAREMLDRAGVLLQQGLAEIQGGTFHSFAYAMLRLWPPDHLAGRPFTLLDSRDITAAVKLCKEELKIGHGDRSFPKAQNIAAFLSKARNKELPVTEVLEREAFHLLSHAEAFTRLGAAYNEYRRKGRLLDYDDLLFELEALLRDNREAAQHIRQRFTHILVDEYQDTNPVQARITRLLASGDSGNAGNVMVVGDEAQSIYAFRGADVRNILDFPKLFPDTRVIRLEENYRSTQPVLDVANALLANSAESYGKTLFTKRKIGDSARLVTPLSDMSQARLVTLRIEELLDTYPPQEIAVLFRAGFHSYHLEMALQHARIPFRKYGGLRYTEAAHVKDCIAFARLALNPLDMPALTRIAALHSGIGPKTANKIYNALLTNQAMEKIFARYPGLLEDMRFVETLRAASQPPVDVLGAILEYYFPRMETLFPEDWPRRRQGLEEIVQMAAAYTELDIFMADIALEPPEDSDNKKDDTGRVVLSTVHSAKGLEWDAVLIIDLVEDRFPSRYAMARSEDFEEERRLMYVACTRARKRLDLYAPATLYSRADHAALHAAPSPFVRELPLACVEEWQENIGGRLVRKHERAAHADQTGQTARTRHARAASHSALSDSSGQAGRACRHRIFGKGAVVCCLPPDKVQVDFPGFGRKVILREYLFFED